MSVIQRRGRAPTPMPRAAGSVLGTPALHVAGAGAGRDRADRRACRRVRRWARSCARFSPASRRSSAGVWARSIRKAGAGRPGRGIRAAGRLRRRARSDLRWRRTACARARRPPAACRAVCERITAYLTGVQERLRKADLCGGGPKAHAEEEQEAAQAGPRWPRL